MPDEIENTENLKEEDENILLWATLGIGFGIDIFITRIEREVALLRNAGISETAIVNILGNDLATGGRIFGEFRNTIKRGIISATMQASRVGQDRVYGDSLEMQWVSVGSPTASHSSQVLISPILSSQSIHILGDPTDTHCIATLSP